MNGGKLFLLGALACLIYIVYSVVTMPTAPNPADVMPVGERPEAPDLTLNELAAGQPWSLADHRGEVVLLNFWASTCGYCLKEMPALKAIHNKFAGQDFRLVGVNTDWDAAKASAIVASQGLPYTVLLDGNGAASRAYDVSGIPHSALIDREGRIAAVWVGYRPGMEKTLSGAIAKLLAEETVSEAPSAPNDPE